MSDEFDDFLPITDWSVEGRKEYLEQNRPCIELVLYEALEVFDERKVSLMFGSQDNAIDRIIGMLSSRSRRAEQGLEPIKEHLLLTRYSPKRVEEGEMLSVEDVEEILAVPLLGVIPESQAVLKASNSGEPVILDSESDAGQAYQDAVDRLLGETVDFRFLVAEKKGIFSRIFGG